jgi:hypothetical protein
MLTLFNSYECLKAVKKAESIRTDRSFKCNIVVVEDGEEKYLSNEELKLFELKLPLKDKLRKIITSESMSNEMSFEREIASYLKLYK